jgi:D-arabinose 1-dehydrogenase-like Zn-dependent alcohol dehydrogenase
MMRAAVLRAFEQPLDVSAVEHPQLGPGQVLLRVRAAALCGTDRKIWAGQVATTSLPHVLGHEIAGEVASASPDFHVGDRVAVYPLRHCGTCAPCLQGDTNLCDKATRIGFELPGGFAEFIAVDARDLVRFGSGLSFSSAAVCMDAVLTAWRAIHTRARVRVGQRVAVIGVGGIGVHAVQLALNAGAEVVAIDPVESHRGAAIRVGATEAFDPESAASAPTRPVDCVIETSGTESGFRLATRLIRSGGTVVTCGYQVGADVSIDSTRLTLKELSLVGSRGGTIAEAREVIAAAESGRVHPEIAEEGDLTDANAFMNLLRESPPPGRLVLHP